MLHLSLFQIIILALLQGITELFPVSSLGHTIIFPAILNWGQLVHSKNFLPFIVALHMGTSIALIVYFLNDWIDVLKTLFMSIKDGEVKTSGKEWTGWLIIIGCIPAGLLGVFLETPLKHIFGTPIIASIFLIINGFILLFGEMQRRRMKETDARKLSGLTWKDAVFIGTMQALALLPGISRSGITMVAGLTRGLDHEHAARYSFLLGAPIISAAAILEIPSLLGQPRTATILIIIGMILSGAAAALSTKFLLKYFKTNTLIPFAFYSWITGGLSLLFFLIAGR